MGMRGGNLRWGWETEKSDANKVRMRERRRRKEKKKDGMEMLNVCRIRTATIRQKKWRRGTRYICIYESGVAVGEAKEGCERGKMKVREECDGEAEKNGDMRWRIV